MYAYACNMRCNRIGYFLYMDKGSKHSILVLIIALLVALSLGFIVWFVVMDYQGKITPDSALGQISRILPVHKKSGNTTSASKQNNGSKLSEIKVDRNKNACLPSDKPKESSSESDTDTADTHYGTYYDCFGADNVLQLKDIASNTDTSNTSNGSAASGASSDVEATEGTNMTAPTPDMQLIMNDVAQYKMLNDLNDCAASYNYNTSRMNKEDYDKCSLGWFKDDNGTLTAIYTDQNGNPATITQNMKKTDGDGIASSVDIYTANRTRAIMDYNQTIKTGSDDDVLSCMKANDYNVNKAEANCDSYGAYTGKDTDNICALMPNTYGQVSAGSRSGVDVNVSKDGKWITICAVDTVKAAAKKAAADAAKKKADDAKKQSESSQPVLDANGHDTRNIGTIVDEVINGKYANGDERKKLLGDRYDEVQKQVNQKCLVDKDPRCVINSM